MANDLVDGEEFFSGEYRADIEKIGPDWWLTIARSSDGFAKVFRDDSCPAFKRVLEKSGASAAIEAFLSLGKWEPHYKARLW